MITISEVARLAKVSKATVSRVLNKNGYVGEDTRKRVEEVIKKFHYTPSASAVNLSKQESNTIGVVVPEIANPFFGQVLHGISEAINPTDFTLLYFNTDNDSLKEERALQTLGKQRICGLLITPARDFDTKSIFRLCEKLDWLNVPTVIMDRDFLHSKWDGVFFENYQSGYCAGKELILAGNKSLGIITGDLNLKIARERYEGFIQASKDYGCPIEDRFIFSSDFTIEGGYWATKQLLAAQDRPQAVLTCNNLLTLGFLKGITEQGLHLGQDIALIGIDQIPELDFINFNLSYIQRDAEEMGRQAVRVLLERINNPSLEQQICKLPFSFVRQGSEALVKS